MFCVLDCPRSSSSQTSVLFTLELKHSFGEQHFSLNCTVMAFIQSLCLGLGS